MMEFLTDSRRNVVGDQPSDRKYRLFACASWRCAYAAGLKPDYKHSLQTVQAVELFVDGLGVLPDTSMTVAYAGAQRAAMAAAQHAPHTAGYDSPSAYEIANILRDIVGNPYRPLIRASADGQVVIGAPMPEDPPHRIAIFDASTWLTSDVLSLAGAAYEERGRECDWCKGTGRGCGKTVVHLDPGPNDVTYSPCMRCNGIGHIEDGTLDPFRLSLLADALEDVGCVVVEGRTIAEVVHDQRNRAIYGGCCERFADNMGCDCLSRARPEDILTHLRSSGPHYRGCHVVDAILGRM